MDKTNIKTSFYILVGVFLATALLFLVAVVHVFLSHQKIVVNFQNLENTYHLIYDLEQNTSRITSLELAQKDYMISDEKFYLDKSDSIRNVIYNIHQKALQNVLTAPDSIREKIVNIVTDQRLHILEIRKLDSLKSYISKPAVPVIAQLRKGNNTIDSLSASERNLIYQLHKKLRAEYTIAYEAMSRSIILMQWIGLICVGLSLLLLFAIWRYYKRIAAAQNELYDLNENKNKFFSIISHDLRGPVKNIALMAQFLTDKQTKSVDKDRIATLIESSAKNLSSLLDNLLKWSRLQMNTVTFMPEKLNLQNVVDDVIRHLKVHAEQKNIELKNMVVPGKEIFVDQNMLSTVLRNLISNSIKFSHKGSTIEVYATFFPSKVEVTVKDHGVGMPEAIVKNIFNMNFKHSTKGTNKEEGSGLGLKLCKEFIEKNGGNIWMESVEGQGTSCTFTLPLALVKD